MQTMIRPRQFTPGWPCDRIGIVGFNDRATMITNLAEPHDAALLQGSQSLHNHTVGGTNMAAGIRLGVEMLRSVPRGVLRRVWLLSDGKPNIEAGHSLDEAVQQARNSYININTIGFGMKRHGAALNGILSVIRFDDGYDEELLRRIAGQTHHGSFVSAASLRELAGALTGSARPAPGSQFHRPEATVLVIDLSGSMNERMEGHTKVQLVEEACLQLLIYKQRLYSRRTTRYP